MPVEIREIADRRELKTFIFLPEKIHAGRPNWTPPIWIDEWQYFDPRKNSSFEHCDTLRLLAWRGSEAVGRIMGIIHHRYNEHFNERTARFGFLETWEDQEVFHALLERVEEWARDRGMERVVGPYGFSDQDPEGWLIEGFEHHATIATYYNFPWTNDFIEAAGYTKDVDYFVYRVPVTDQTPAFYRRIHDRVMKRGGFQLVTFSKKKELRPWVEPILSLMNEAYTGSGIYGYAPLNSEEMHELARKYLPILDPRFVKVVTREDEPVAFVVAMPDLTEGIRAARGRLLPLGLFKILRARKRTEQLDLLIGAIKEEHRGKGLDVLIAVDMFESARQAGLTFMDTHHELEYNTAVRAEMERINGEIYKRFRIYQKAL